MLRAWRTHMAALLVALSLAAPAAAQTVTPAVAQLAGGTLPHIDNFGKVGPGYYRGAQPHGRDFDDLAALGVKTVIDLAEEGDPAEAAAVKQAGMTFVRIPMNTRIAPTSAQLAQFLQLVDDSANQPVYVHCQGGRHRTGVMTAVYRMTHENWTADRAFAEMKQFKFGADFLHPEFKRFVYTFREGLDRSAVAAAAQGSLK